MQQDNVYMVFFAKNHQTEGLLELINEGETFSHVFSSKDTTLPPVAVYLFVAPDDSLYGAALGTRSVFSAATYSLKVKFDGAIRVDSDPSGPARPTVAPLLMARPTLTFGSGQSSVSRVRWSTIKGALDSTHQEFVRAVENLFKWVANGEAPHDLPGLEIAQGERDSLLLSLDLAGFEMEKSKISRMHSKLEVDGPFLSQLERTRKIEDADVVVDCLSVPDMALRKIVPAASLVAQFENATTKLVVINANRTKLESATGADLIYINEARQSFVFVQYKVMRQRDEETGEARYWPDSDQNLPKQIADMATLTQKLSLSNVISASDWPEIRLHDGPCFIKVCAPYGFKPIGSIGEMSKGMYFSLEHWEQLMNSQCLRGPKKGRSVGFDNAGQYLNNTLFIELVKGGWLGSRRRDHDVLEKLLLGLLQEGIRDARSVTLGIQSAKPSVIVDMR